MGRDWIELLLGVSEMFGRKKTEQRISDLELLHNSTVHAMFDNLSRLDSVKYKQNLLLRAYQKIGALRSRIVALETLTQGLQCAHCDRNGTAVPIGTKLLGGYMVIGYRDNGFDVTLDDGTGCQATGIYFLPTTDAVLERLPK